MKLMWWIIGWAGLSDVDWNIQKGEWGYRIAYGFA